MELTELEGLLQADQGEFRIWESQRDAAFKARYQPLINDARQALDEVIETDATPRRSFYGNEKISGVSFRLSLDETVKNFSPISRALFKEVWSASTNPLLYPKSALCHIIRSDRVNEVMGDSQTTYNSSVYGLTILFDDSEYGYVKTVLKPDNSLIELNAASAWRPEPLMTSELSRIQNFLEVNPEGRNRLALLLCQDATKPSTLELARQNMLVLS